MWSLDVQGREYLIRRRQMTRRFGGWKRQKRIGGRAPLQSSAIETRPLITARNCTHQQSVARCRVLQRSYVSKLGWNAARDRKREYSGDANDRIEARFSWPGVPGMSKN